MLNPLIHVCEQCKGEWTHVELNAAAPNCLDPIRQFEEKEGCPDCLWECERCGDLVDGKGTFEHCL